MSLSPLPVLTIAPAQVVRGWAVLSTATPALNRLGQRPVVLGGPRSVAAVRPVLDTALADGALAWEAVHWVDDVMDCTEATLERLRQMAHHHRADCVVGVGGGKALDTAKLLAHQLGQPVATVPTSAATCAAWTALSNVYSEDGAFLYDVALIRCPDLLILDYDLVKMAPPSTLVAGIGDALAKWYEASVSSGHSEQTLIVSAVQQARVLRDLLLQKSETALAQWGGSEWQEVVDATVLLAGVIGGVGGAQCRTVAAHAVHNGLTHLAASHGTLHGDKVAYGILVQLRLEEMATDTSLATAARQQLLTVYRTLGLPKTLADLGLGGVSLQDLERAAQVACREGSDIHHLPFAVTPEALLAAMVSPCCPALRPVGDGAPAPVPSPVEQEISP